MTEHFVRHIKIYKNYFWDFYNYTDEKVRKKIQWTIDLVKTVDRISKKYFEHLANTSGLYEIRIEYNSNIYRIFSFFDEGNLVILINGFQKKSQKTPKEEIERAERLKEEYFAEKQQFLIEQKRKK